VGEIGGVTEELLDQRLVETEFLADLLDRLLVSPQGQRNTPRDRRAAPASAGT